MKTKILMAAISAALLLGSVQAQEPATTDAAAQPGFAAIPGVATNWRQIAIPALPPFKPQQPNEWCCPMGWSSSSPRITSCR